MRLRIIDPFILCFFPLVLGTSLLTKTSVPFPRIDLVFYASKSAVRLAARACVVQEGEG